jgi:dihydrofolate reductase
LIVTYYVASSVDGYIAKENGDVSWLFELGIPMEETGYDEFFATVDGLVMGSKTYEMIHTFGNWPYGNKPTWVCTKSKIKSITGANIQKDTSPEDVIEEARKMKINHLWLVGGGNLAAYFIEHSLLTNILVTQMPIILGSGIKLFGSLENTKRIQLKDCKTIFDNFLQIEYEIKKT